MVSLLGAVLHCNAHGDCSLTTEASIDVAAFAFLLGGCFGMLLTRR